MNEKHKFCKDCRFWDPGDNKTEADRLRYAKCSQEAVVLWNSTNGGGDETEYLATGVTQKPYCSGARFSTSPCGLEGKLFEQRDRDAWLLPRVEAS